MSSRNPAGGALALAVLLGGLFMAALDTTIVNVAAPDISSELGATGSTLVLIVSGYSIAYATLLVASARMGDRRGHRRMYATGMVGFVVASLACGLAPEPGVLIAARFVQGAAAALMTTQIMSIIQLQFSGRERERAIALYSAVIALGAVLGLVIGGGLVSIDLLGAGWRPVFLVNVPTGLALLALIPRTVAESGGDARRTVDLSGTLLLGGAVLALVLPAVLGREEGWPWWTYASFAVGVVLAIDGAIHVRRAASGQAIVDAAIFRAPGFTSGLLAIFTSMVAYGGFLFSSALLLQTAFGYGAIHAGLVFVPYAVAFAATSIVGASLEGAAKRWAPAVGLAVLGAGYVGIGELTSGGAWHEGAAALLLGVAGGGFGLGYSPVITIALEGVAPAHAADASGAVSTINQLGFVVGIAVLGSVFLGAADLPSASSAGDAFFVLSLLMAGLALVAAAFAGWACRSALGDRLEAAPVA